MDGLGATPFPVRSTVVARVKAAVTLAGVAIGNVAGDGVSAGLGDADVACAGAAAGAGVGTTGGTSVGNGSGGGVITAFCNGWLITAGVATTAGSNAGVACAAAGAGVGTTGGTSVGNGSGGGVMTAFGNGWSATAGVATAAGSKGSLVTGASGGCGLSTGASADGPTNTSGCEARSAICITEESPNWLSGNNGAGGTVATEEELSRTVGVSETGEVLGTLNLFQYTTIARVGVGTGIVSPSGSVLFEPSPTPTCSGRVDATSYK